MRPLAGLAIAFGVSGHLCVAAGAVAQTRPTALESGASSLTRAAFAQASNEAYGPPPSSDDPIAGLLDRQAVRAIDWTAKAEVSLTSPDGATVDTLKFSTGDETLPVWARPLSRDALGPSAYEVSLTRDWPGAMRFEGERFGLDVTPHAGFGVSSAGSSAEAGAAITLSRKSADERVAEGLSALGLRDGERLGSGGRWYVFAAASGRAMGLNMLRDGRGWDRTWSQDAASTLIGDTQVGVGWKKGSMQTSFGYIHREVKGDHMLWGQDTKADSMVAFSLAIKPRK